MDRVKWIFVDMWNNHSATFISKDDALSYASNYMAQVKSERFGVGECVLAKITHESILYGESEKSLTFVMNYIGDDNDDVCD